MKRIWIFMAVTALLLLSGCRENENTTVESDDSVAATESNTQETAQAKDSVISEFLSQEEIEQVQGLMKEDYHTLFQSIEEYGTMDEYEIGGGRLLVVPDGVHSPYWGWSVLIYDNGSMYIEQDSYHEHERYSNATVKEMPQRVRYLVDEEVRNHAIFNRFIENEISAYDSAVDRDMYMADYYEEYHYGKNNVFDESWCIYGVHFMAEDLDGDEEDELLVFLQLNAYGGDLLVFNEVDGELYAWQIWEGFYDDRLPDITCYDDGVIRMFGPIGLVKGYYNSDGTLEGMHWRERGERADSENADVIYKYGSLCLYENGMDYDNIVKNLYYEGTYYDDGYALYAEGWTGEMTPENQLIKEEVDAIITEWDHFGAGREVRHISPIQSEDEAGIVMLKDLLRMVEVPEGAEAASVYDEEFTLTLGMNLEEFRDYYGEEYIPSTVTPTQLIGTQMIDGTYYKWYFFAYEDVSIDTTNYNRKTGDSSEYTICQINLWDSPRFHTSKGISIGDTLEELTEAYGKALKLTDVERYDCSYDYTENGIVTSFYINQDSVVGISIRLQ